MRALVLVFVSTSAYACPACASSNNAGPRWLHLVLVLLPFVVVAAAARAIYTAMRGDA